MGKTVRSFRVSILESAAIDKAAKENKITTSEYIRRCVFGASSAELGVEADWVVTAYRLLGISPEVFVKHLTKAFTAVDFFYRIATCKTLSMPLEIINGDLGHTIVFHRNDGDVTALIPHKTNNKIEAVRLVILTLDKTVLTEIVNAI